MSEQIDINYVSRIALSPEYEAACKSLEEIIASSEISENALNICAEVIKENPAHYTAWNCRFNIFKQLNKDYSQELQFVNKIAEASPKNFQLWRYRQRIFELAKKETQTSKTDLTPLIQDEMQILSNLLKEDQKIYHVWSYRLWLCQTFDLWQEELEYTTRLIKQDLLNNSAWSQHVACLSNMNNVDYAEELKFVEDCIEQKPENISAWNFRSYLLQNKLDVDNETSEAFVDTILRKHPQCRPALLHKENWSQLEIVDPIRKNYYQAMRQN